MFSYYKFEKINKNKYFKKPESLLKKILVEITE